MTLLLILCCLSPGLAAPEAFPLKDLHTWSIVSPPSAIPSERYAAEELQGFLHAACGVELPILETPAASKNNLFIGPGEAMQASSAAVSLDDLGEEDLRIRIRPDNIVIAGGRPRGTLYGVYEFAERYLGIRFLTFDHTHIPKADDQATLPVEDFTYRPPFSFRWSYYAETSAQPPFAARLCNNTVTRDEKLGGITPQTLINHSYYRYISPEKYAAEHPEYFAQVMGEHLVDIGRRAGEGPQPCVTHPDVIRIMTEGLLSELRANPGRHNIDLSQNDNDVYCRCGRCEEINRAEGSPMGANLLLVNTVAEAVEKEFPDVKIGTLAYWYTRKPPKNMKPRHNVQIMLCSIECCITHPLDDPEIKKNRAFCADLEGWGRISNNIFIWDYNTNFFAYDLPCPNLRTISRNLRFFQRNNVHGVFMQANGNGNAGEMSDLRNYVMSRCLWNPELDDWALVEEFCRLHYGNAVGTMLEYLEYIHDIAQNSGSEPGCFGTKAEFGITREVAMKAHDYFSKALEEAGDPAVRHRVEKASICAYRALLDTVTELRFDNGNAYLASPPPLEDLFGRYVDLCARYNMTHAAEWLPLGVFLEETRRLMAGVPANRFDLENWRFTNIAMPAQRIIEVLHIPSKRHLRVSWPGYSVMNP